MKANRKAVEIIMARNCINLSDLVKLSEMPEPTVKNVVYGRSVNPKTIGRVAKALNVDVSEIMEKES